jgi:FemAB-related protein (PEP-CTERM system-associated)
MGSIPFLNYGGVLGDDNGMERFLLDAAFRLAIEKSADYLELRHIAPKEISGPVRTQKVTMILDFEKDIESQWKSFDPKLRNQIKKAEKSGLGFHIGGKEMIDDFYKVFSINMRDLGTPVYAKSFFLNILDHFPGSSNIISVTLDDATIAAGISLSFRDTVEVPWASSLKGYRALCPNNLLYWGIIKMKIREGFRHLDFGRSTVDTGTYRFKEQWGPRAVPLHWQYWVKNGIEPPRVTTDNPKYAIGIRIWKKIPTALANMLGPWIVKNIP